MLEEKEIVSYLKKNKQLVIQVFCFLLSNRFLAMTSVVHDQ